MLRLMSCAGLVWTCVVGGLGLSHAAAARGPHSLLLPPDGTTTLASGTGFYVSRDGAAVTAAHVVQGCRRVDVSSDTDPTREAHIVFADDVADLAVLRIPGATTHAVLPVASAPPLPDQAGLRVVGYGHDTPVRPGAVPAQLLNGHVIPGRPADPRSILWLRAPQITYGWSGGPVLDEAGEVVGAVLSFEPQAGELAQVLDRPQPGVALATGIGPIRSVLRRAGVAPDAMPSRDASGRAAIRVLCWR